MLLQRLVAGAGEGALIAPEDNSSQVPRELRATDFNGDNSLFSVKDDVIDHAAFVFGVVQAERAAQVLGTLHRRGCVATLNVHRKCRPEAGEEWTILTFVEFLAAVPVSIVAPHALDVLGVELAELAAEVPLRHLVRGGGWRWH